MLQEAIVYVNDAYNHTHIKHFERTLFWVLQFKPDADEALQIAAYCHDIERALRKPGITSKGYLDKEFLKYHQEKGAEIMYEWLRENGAEEAMATRVRHLISKHEEGGDQDQTLLKDCDSLSFFETNAARFAKKKVLVDGEGKVREKLDWMYERISSPEVKQQAKPLYEESLRLMEETLSRVN